MKDRFIFNVCAFLGMFVTMLIIVSFLKGLGVHVSSKHMIMMIGIIVSLSWFADVFFKLFCYLLIAEGLNYPWMWSHDRENLSYLANEDLKEFHWSEVLTVLIVIIIGYCLMNVILSPYAVKLGTGLKLTALLFAALWLGGMLIGGLLYVIFKSCSDSQ